MIFKKKKLIEFLSIMKKIGKIELFHKCNFQKKVILLRHDVDFDLTAAYNFALLEKRLNIESTYFILTSSPAYNILAKRNSELINKISNMGHEIGLHFDASIYNNNFEKHAKNESNILSSVINKKIKSISVHNPSIHGIYPKFNGFINAYDKRIFNDKQYMSDSSMSFRGKNPFEFIKSVKKNTIQVLLHPIHYTSSGGSYDKIFYQYLKNQVIEIKKEWSVSDRFKKDIKNKKKLINIF